MEDCRFDAKGIDATVRKLPGGAPSVSNAPSFWRDEERALADAFVRDGYVIIPAESRADLDRIRDLMADIAASFLKLPRPRTRARSSTTSTTRSTSSASTIFALR